MLVTTIRKTNSLNEILSKLGRRREEREEKGNVKDKKPIIIISTE